MRYAFHFPNLMSAVHLDAQAVGEHLETLIEKFQERLTPEEIVADARKTHSPLHANFEWDEGKAAEAHRRKQARQLLTNLIVAQPKNTKRGRTRAFVFVHHPDHDGKKVILNIRSAMGRPEMREQVLEAAVKAFDRWTNSYSGHPGMRFAKRDIARLRDKLRAELLAATA